MTRVRVPAAAEFHNDFAGPKYGAAYNRLQGVLAAEGVIAETAHHVAVMYAGKVVESAPVEELFERPKHPYTVGLFRSLPRLEQESERLEVIDGNVPNPLQFPSGCKFRPRCPHATEACAETEPELVNAAENHLVSCHHWEEVFKAANAGNGTTP